MQVFFPPGIIIKYNDWSWSSFKQTFKHTYWSRQEISGVWRQGTKNGWSETAKRNLNIGLKNNPQKGWQRQIYEVLTFKWKKHCVQKKIYHPFVSLECTAGAMVTHYHSLAQGCKWQNLTSDSSWSMGELQYGKYEDSGWVNLTLNQLWSLCNFCKMGTE